MLKGLVGKRKRKEEQHWPPKLTIKSKRPTLKATFVDPLFFKSKIILKENSEYFRNISFVEMNVSKLIN